MFEAYGSGPTKVIASAMVYVVHGQVSIGTAHSNFNNTWEWVEAHNGVSPANELIVYASSPGGADYFVGFARVNESP